MPTRRQGWPVTFSNGVRMGGERAQCVAMTDAGEQCSIRANLCPEHRTCLWHDECRAPEAAAARAKGGRRKSYLGRKHGRKSTGNVSTIRTASPTEIPPLDSLDDCVTASAWIFRSAASGALDPATSRESLRAVTTFVNAVHKSELQKRIRELEAVIRQYERARARTSS